MGVTFILASWLLVGQVEAGQTKAEADKSKTAAAKKAATDRAALARQVRKLMRQLDADELATRDAAEKALVQLGPKILDLIPPTNAGTPAEVKERIGRVVKVLETKVAESATKASRVTLQGEMTLSEALAKLREQTGNKTGEVENGSAKIKANYKDVTYWEALDQVLDQAGLNINAFGGIPRTLSLVSRPPEEKPRFGNAHYSGLFRFEPVRVEAVRDIRNPRINGLRVALDITWEPHTTPISITQQLSQVKALDENDQEIPVNNPAGVRTASGEASISAATLELPFKLPNRSVKKIKSLEGTLTAMVPGRVEAFEFTNLAKVNQPRRKAGVTVVFERLRKNGGLHEAQDLVRFDESANALESHRGWIFNNEAYMVDDKGKRLRSEAIETTAQTITSVGLAYLFDLEKDPKQYKFVYKTPALVIKLPVKFRIKDIDLP